MMKEIKFARNIRKAYLAGIGDVNDPRTWSGIPYHFMEAAKAEHLAIEGLCLNVECFSLKSVRIC